MKHRNTNAELKSEGDKWVFTHGGECACCHRTELTELNKNDTCFECWNNY